MGPKAQVVIPKPVRDAMGVRPGDDVYFRIDDQGRVLLERKSPQQWLEEFINAVPKRLKLKEPKHIDWDALYEEQIEERLGFRE